MTNVDRDSFVDANILVYAAFQDDVRHEACKALLEQSGPGVLYISSQILAEFYSTVTNPKRVSAPYSTREAVEFMETLLSFPHIAVLSISRDVPIFWISSLKTISIKGPQVFDLQIVATMMAHGITRIFTYNGADLACSQTLK